MGEAKYQLVSRISEPVNGTMEFMGRRIYLPTFKIIQNQQKSAMLLIANQLQVERCVWFKHSMDRSAYITLIRRSGRENA